VWAEERAKALELARTLKVDGAEKLGLDALKRAVIAAKMPTMKLDGVSADFVTGVWNGIVATAPAAAPGVSAAFSPPPGTPPPAGRVDEFDAAAAEYRASFTAKPAKS
jgi:hypothetical protein